MADQSSDKERILVPLNGSSSADRAFEFALSMLIGLVVYGGVMLGVERFFDYDMRRIVRTVQKSLA